MNTATDRSYGWFANRDRLIVELDSTLARMDYVPKPDRDVLERLVGSLRTLARWNEKDTEVYVRRIISAMSEVYDRGLYDRIGTILVNFQVITDDRARPDLRQRIANQEVW